MVEIKNIKKVYRQGITEVLALNDVSFEFGERGFYSIIGESGCGKTTLLNLLSGMDIQTSGEIFIEGKSTTSFTQSDWDYYRSKTIGYVFQDYNVFDIMSVEDNIKMPLEINAPINEDVEKMVFNVAKRMNISDIVKQRTGNLSGGQKQRVSLARAIIKQPKIILADEPTGNLDGENSDMIFRLLKEISQNTLVVLVTHDRDRAEQFSDVIISMADGSFTYVLDKRETSEVVSVTVDGREEIVADFFSLKKILKLLSVSETGRQFNVSLKTIQGHKEDEIPNGDRILFKTKKLSFNKIRTYAQTILFRRRARRVLMVLMLAVAFVLLCVPVGILNYSTSKVQSSYVEKYKDDTFVGKKIKDYFLGEYEEKLLSNSMEVRNSLEQIVDENDLIFKTDEVRIARANVINEEDFLEIAGIKATLIKLSDEIFEQRSDGKIDADIPSLLITDYLADQLGVDEKEIGEMFFVGTSAAVLKGIIYTDYKEVIPKLDLKMYEDIYVKDDKYNVFYVNDSLIKAIYSNPEKLITVSNNYFFDGVPRNYLTTDLYISSIAVLEQQIDYGRMPENRNEIVLGGFFAQKMGLYPENGVFTEMEYSLLNIYDDQYDGNFMNSPNLYDILGETVRIVGISNLLNGDIAVREEQFSKIISLEKEAFGFDYIGVASERVADCINSITDIDYSVADDNLKKINSVETDLREKKGFAIAMLIGCLFLVSGVIIFEVRYEIKDNYRSIGILKALGFTNRDVRKVFFLFPMRMICFSLIGGVIGAAALWISVNINAYVSRNLCYRKFFLFRFDSLPFVLSGVFVVIFALLMAWLPINDIKNRALIGVIKK